MVEFFVDQHRAGVTPNPCMECNRHIRFTWLLNNRLARRMPYSCDRPLRAPSTGRQREIRHQKGVDDHKDQSYVLSVLTQAQLQHALFPVGDYAKTEVREIAARFGLPTASKKDSQDLCFLGNGNYRDFLIKHAPDTMVAGPIVMKNGQVIGEHSGLVNYTIGQRKGLGVTFSEPLYVIGMNPYRNALIVGTREDLGGLTLTAHRVNWVSGETPPEPFRAEVKIRYKAAAVAALVEPLDDERMRVTFDEPLRDITPGQGAVVYDGDVVLGGGIIEKSL
ncbi:MAG: tRNA 2-thiouridine(34) synthase MnmA [Anaerolineae bacterium]